MDEKRDQTPPDADRLMEIGQQLHGEVTAAAEHIRTASGLLREMGDETSAAAIGSTAAGLEMMGEAFAMLATGLDG